MTGNSGKELIGQKIKDLRSELKKLRKKRDELTLKKGLSAQEDAHRNHEKFYLEQQIHGLSSKINDIIEEIYDLSRKK